MSERKRAKAAQAFHKAAYEALQAGIPAEGLIEAVRALAATQAAGQALAGHKPPTRFDRPGAGE